jgi:Phage integrase family
MADVDIRTVAELMGHKSIQMTMRYAHLAPQHKLVAVERLARIYFVRLREEVMDAGIRFHKSARTSQPTPEPTPRKGPLRELLMGL